MTSRFPTFLHCSISMINQEKMLVVCLNHFPSQIYSRHKLSSWQYILQWEPTSYFVIFVKIWDDKIFKDDGILQTLFWIIFPYKYTQETSFPYGNIFCNESQPLTSCWDDKIFKDDGTSFLLYSNYSSNFFRSFKVLKPKSQTPMIICSTNGRNPEW